MAAPTVSERESANRTIRGKISKKKPQAKNVIVDPFHIVWPVVQENIQTEIMQKLKSSLMNVSVGRPKTEKFSVKAKDKKERKRLLRELRQEREKERKNRKANSQEENIRSQLVIGLNKVTRSLERDELGLVLVSSHQNAQLKQMVDHLIPMCMSRGCPAVCLTGLQMELAPLLTVSSLLALGITKGDLNENPLHSVVEYIAERCEPLHVPWLEKPTSSEPVDSEQSVTKAHQETLSSRTISSVEAKSDTSSFNISDIYVYKEIKPNRTSDFEELEFIKFREVAESDEETVSYTLPKSSKTKEVNVNKDPSEEQFSNVSSARSLQTNVMGQSLCELNPHAFSSKTRRHSEPGVITYGQKNFKKAKIRQKMSNSKKVKNKLKRKQKDN